MIEYSNLIFCAKVDNYGQNRLKYKSNLSLNVMIETLTKNCWTDWASKFSL